MNTFWKYIKAASIGMSVGVVAYYAYKNIHKMFACD